MTPQDNPDMQRKTIGVFVSQIGRVWAPEFLQGITAAAEAHDLNMICFVGGKPTATPIAASASTNPGDSEPSYGLYDIARTRQLAGIIVSADLGYELGARETRQFFKNYSHLPLIVNALQLGGIPNLVADNLRGMRTLVGHLLDAHAYKRVAFICGPEHQIEAGQRFLAYQQELQAHNIPLDEKLVLPGDFSMESGRAAIRTLLDERGMQVDAIVAANDRMAIGAFEALQQRGIQVPGNIALTGFDDIREARSLGVPLTTVRQSFHEMGFQAVELLLRRINGDKLPDNIIRPTQLVVRWSCGCLPESIQKVAGHEIAVRPGGLESRREAVVVNLLQAAEIHSLSPQASAFTQAGGQAWDALVASLRSDEKKAGDFLHSLEVLLTVLALHSEDPTVWHNVVSVLRQHALAGISGHDQLLKAEALLQQARILIGELSQRHQALQRMRIDLRDEVLQSFSTAMAPAMNLEEIGAAVERHYPQLGIGRMYVMFYSDMVFMNSTLMPPSDNFNLLMQYEDIGFDMPADHPKWATGHLIPRGKTPENRRYSAIVMPLNLPQNRFGFMWMEMNAPEWDLYARIRNLLSSALLRVFLVEQRAKVQLQVEQLLKESQTREQQLALANETARKIAQENAGLYTNEQVHRKDAEALSRVMRNLSTLIKMDELPGQILKELANLVLFEWGALIIEDHTGSVQIVAQSGFPKDADLDDMLAQLVSAGLYIGIVQSGEPIISEASENSSPWQPAHQAWMGVPLFSGNKVIGMLSLTCPEGAKFSQDDLLLVKTFGMQAAISLENARLYDEQTRFNEMLERLVEQRVEELNTAYTRLEKLDKNKTSFIEIAAHELRTPLTVLKGYVGMLKANDVIQGDKELAPAVDGMARGADRLQLIFDSMLDLVRFDEQSVTLRKETVIVALLLQFVHKKYKRELAERSLLLQFDNGLSSLPLIQADPILLQKAFDAVIVNAIKFTPDGGSITLGGKLVADKQLGSCVEISIRDTGIGIDPANHQIIFEKLFQLGKAELHSSGRTKFKGGGPGLGLAIATAIVSAHRGRIWVESPGCDEKKLPGSTFFILLPAKA